MSAYTVQEGVQQPAYNSYPGQQQQFQMQQVRVRYTSSNLVLLHAFPFVTRHVPLLLFQVLRIVYVCH